jgi:hypothetical protein
VAALALPWDSCRIKMWQRVWKLRFISWQARTRPETGPRRYAAGRCVNGWAPRPAAALPRF